MTNDKRLAVVGLGYVGLPLALLAAKKKISVVGIDIDPEKVAAISSGNSPIEDAAVKKQLKECPLLATSDFSKIGECDVVVVAVPTPVTDAHEPDLRPLEAALRDISAHAVAGQVLIVESTVNPGVMQEVVIPALGEVADQLYVAHCPERINPGDTRWTVENIPRVIGGVTPEATARAKEFYDHILEAEVLPMKSVTEAEAVKILENTFRDINIAFVNEMAKSFDKLGIDITHVIAGAATKPFAFLPHYPGSGVGGHCISVDPYYMIERARQVGFEHSFLQLARDINNSMPEYTITRLMDGAAKAGLDVSTSEVALLGMAYKKNIDDVRESPCFEIRALLEKRGLAVRVFDPHVPQHSTVSSLSEALDGASIMILGTDHDEFLAGLSADMLEDSRVQLVVDGKNALDGPALASGGIHYIGIGRQYWPSS